jgi:transcriptional regulator with XRE-family HTH domain
MQRNDQTRLTRAIARRLVERRKRMKMSQAELADLLGISRSYLSTLEAGTREMSVTTLVRLCRKLGMTPNTLLGYK